MAESICESFQATAARLLDLGLGYLSLDREAATLSTGEHQRVQLARSGRNRTTGVLYVLDEPSIGLHPSNIEGLRGVMHDLIADGNSIVLVDHDTEILRDADWLIEMGPGAGENGGTILTQGTVEQVAQSPASRIGPFLADLHTLSARTRTPEAELFALGTITLRTRAIHTVKPLEVRLPKGRLIAVTGVSGSGKTTLVLESLIPALEAAAKGEALPAHVESITAPGIAQVKLIDATPIGINVRSTVATYANVHDELRKIYARSPLAREKGYKAGDFSYNTGRLRCPGCDGTGTISLDIQFLPDVEITCPDCGGRGYVIRQQRTPFGVMQTQQPCSRCGGKGKLVKNPCKVCHGSGKTAARKTLEVSIPMGIDDDQSFALRGMGDAGADGGPSGDVIVMVTVRPSEVFQRDGYDVWVTVPITYSQAVLGDSITVPSIDGKVEYTVPEGTQSGTTFRLRGKGIQYLNGRGRGDMYVKCEVEIPKKLNKAQRDALKKFEGTLKEENYEKRKGFFKKLKDMFA